MKSGLLTVAMLLALAAQPVLAQQPPAGGGGGDPASFIKGLDKDGDGKLSRSEVAGTPLEADFDAIDTNKDGKLDAQELGSFKPKNVGGGQSGGGAPPAGGTAPPATPPAS